MSRHSPYERGNHENLNWVSCLNSMFQSVLNKNYLNLLFLLPPRCVPVAAPGSPTPGTFNAHCCDPLTHRGLSYRRWPGMGSTLEHHPFSGLVSLAGDLLHTPFADSDFHGNRPAVYSNQHLSWALISVRIGRLNPAFGSSQSASSAYQKWPTGYSHSLGVPDFSNLSIPDFSPIESLRIG